MNTTEMKRYQSAEWNFALDIPRRWNWFPPVSTDSPLEVIRFASKEDGMFELYNRMANSFEFLAE